MNKMVSSSPGFSYGIIKIPRLGILRFHQQKISGEKVARGSFGPHPHSFIGVNVKPIAPKAGVSARSGKRTGAVTIIKRRT